MRLRVVGNLLMMLAALLFGSNLTVHGVLGIRRFDVTCQSTTPTKYDAGVVVKVGNCINTTIGVLKGKLD